MEESVGLGELMSALVAFQSECPVLSFDKKVKTGKYTFDYVTLGKIVQETKPLLAKHGLFISQVPVPSAHPDFVRVKTILGHKSGQVMSSEFEMPVPKKGQTITPQDLGSGLSYAKRYSYSAILSLVTDQDLDGHSPSDVYSGSKEDTDWLKATCKKLGVIDPNIMRSIHEKLLEDTSVKDTKLVAKLID